MPITSGDGMCGATHFTTKQDTFTDLCGSACTAPDSGGLPGGFTTGLFTLSTLTTGLTTGGGRWV